MVNQTDRIGGLVGSIAFKAPCRATTTANITLSGEQVIDGISVVTDDRVLVKDQTSAVENGIYNVSATAWTRARDWNGTRDVVQGTAVRVVYGTISAGFSYAITSTNPVVGQSSVTIERFTDPDTTDLQTQIDTDVVKKTSSTGSAQMPTGTTAQRDVSPGAGDMRHNTSYGRAEEFDGTSWKGLGGASGAGGDAIFYENGQTVTTPYTITTGTNAITAGPIDIDAEVTIPTGSTWSIV